METTMTTQLDDTTPVPPTPQTLRAAALAAYAARQQAEREAVLDEAHAELPRRAAEYLGGLLVTPDMLDNDEFVADGLRFRLAPSGALLVLLPCADGSGLCSYEFADLAALGALLAASD
jgi:hypothetical protein